jgi:chromosome condensin MukBEF MukE localization factor
MNSDTATEHELAKVLLFLLGQKYLTASEAMAYLHLCTQADLQQTVKIDFRAMAEDLGRKKAETCRAYVRKLARLGLLTGTTEHGSWIATFKIELPASVTQPVASKGYQRPLMRNQQTPSAMLDPAAPAVLGGRIE